LAGLSIADNDTVNGGDIFTTVDNKRRYNYTARMNHLDTKPLHYSDDNSIAYGDYTNMSKKNWSTKTKNSYDYSELSGSFEGFYATPYGDLYLSKKLVIGNNFSATRDGYLRAKDALFEECNADSFNIVYTDSMDANGNSNSLYNGLTKK